MGNPALDWTRTHTDWDNVEAVGPSELSRCGVAEPLMSTCAKRQRLKKVEGWYAVCIVVDDFDYLGT